MTEEPNDYLDQTLSASGRLFSPDAVTGEMQFERSRYYPEAHKMQVPVGVLESLDVSNVELTGQDDMQLQGVWLTPDDVEEVYNIELPDEMLVFVPGITTRKDER